jgi:putative pyruvate formate lyase activating enzyme
MKYADDSLARKYSDAPDYVRINRACVHAMFTQSGHLKTDDDGIALSGLVIRHLVLPGAVQNSKDVLSYIAREISREMTVSIMSQYFPAWEAHEHPPLNRALTEEEYEEVVDYALDLGLDNALIQDMNAQGGA